MSKICDIVGQKVSFKLKTPKGKINTFWVTDTEMGKLTYCGNTDKARVFLTRVGVNNALKLIQSAYPTAETIVHAVNPFGVIIKSEKLNIF